MPKELFHQVHVDLLHCRIGCQLVVELPGAAVVVRGQRPQQGGVNSMHLGDGDRLRAIRVAYDFAGDAPFAPLLVDGVNQLVLGRLPPRLR